MPNISDLPTEVVLEVASHLAAFDDTTQISLALTCRHYYGALIHMVLVEQVKEIEKLSSLSKIKPPLYNDPKGTSRIGPNSEIMLFHQQQIGDDGTLHVSVRGMTQKELRSLRCFVCRAHSLRRVMIALFVTMPQCNLKEVAGFVTTCVTRSNLRLHIYGGINGPLKNPFIFHFQEYRSSLQARTNTDDSATSTDSDGARPTDSASLVPTPFSVMRRKHNFQDASLLKPQFSALSLEGEIPFLLPLYPAIVNALNSPITSLSITCVPSTLTLFHWGQIFPSIILPNLKNLSIGNLLIPFPDLLAFLERHQTIETLDLTENSLIGVVKLPFKPFLPCLFSLTANWEYLLPFIKHKIGGYFSALEILHARPYIRTSGPSTAQYPFLEHELHPVYDLLSDGLQPLDLCVTIGASGTIGLVDWLLNMAISSDNRMTHISKLTPLVGVRQLGVESSDLSPSSETAEQLAMWFESYRSSLQEGTQQKEGFMHANNEEKIEILIWTTCLRLEKLKIGGISSAKGYTRQLGRQRVASCS